ncbi:hypothetical protein D3C79_449170 [compost metagenome]
MQVVPVRQVQAFTALSHFLTQAVQTFFQQQREVDRQVRIARRHVAFGLDDPGSQQGFLLIGEHTVAAILHGLTTPPRAQAVQHRFILFADGEAGAGAIGQLVNFAFDPTDGVFREDRRGTELASLVTDNQLIILDPDAPFAQVVSQRHGTPYRQRFILMLLVSFGVVLGAFGTDRWLDDMDQRVLVR